MRTEEIQIYQFDELSDTAKEKAREWWRNDDGDAFQFSSECIIEEAATLAELMGIDLRQRPVKLMGGGTRYEPSVYWDRLEGGGWVAFDAYYSYKKGSVKDIKKEYSDQELHCIAEELQRIQKKHFYQLEASCKYHHYCGMQIDVGHMEDSYRDIGDAEDDIKEALKDFAHWIYKRLQETLEWTYSDENVDESIRANEYEFTEEGERWV